MESGEFIRLLLAGLFGGGLTVTYSFIAQIFKDRAAAKLEGKKVDNADELDNRKFDASLRDELRADLKEAKQIYRDTVAELRQAEGRVVESERLANVCRESLDAAIASYQKSEKDSAKKIKTLTDALAEERMKRRQAIDESRSDYENVANENQRIAKEVEVIKAQISASTDSKP